MIDSEEAGATIAGRLRSADRVALDLEAAGYHRYSDRICLAQVTVDEADFVLDPFAFDVGELLRPMLEDPATEVVMHGASHDLRLLKRDWDIAVRSLFDTHIAAELLGVNGTGLGSLVESRLGFVLPKEYQRADWAVRPLPEAMLRYAASDTRHLFDLADALLSELDELERETWFREECEALVSAVDGWVEPADYELAARVKGAFHLSPRELEALRVALDWRDWIARRRDAAPFRVIGDKALLEVALRRPESQAELQRVRGFPRALARYAGDDLIQRLGETEGIPEREIAPLDKMPRRGSVRVRPDLEPAFQQARVLRNRRADELGLSPGKLLSNAAIADIVRRMPESMEELAAVESVRRWQVKLLGTELIEAVTLIEGEASPRTEAL